MNIGLLTFHTSNNYGALLQTYATLQVLRDLGCDCEIINLRRRPQNIFITYIYNRILNRGFDIFRESYLNPRTEQFYAGDSLDDLNSRYGCFLVGSDQVWRCRFTGKLALHYFLDFAKQDKLKVSFASSFGISTWSETPELTPAVKSLLQRFDAVSVREDSGVDICRSNFDVNATQVLDPSLLLSEDDYGELLKNKRMRLPDRYAVSFLLDGKSSRFEAHIRDVVRQVTGVPTVSVSIPKLNFRGVSFDWNPRPVLDWLYTIRSSEYVLSESFHCVVFALIFKKKFVCIANPRRGKARLESLLGLLGLGDFLIDKEQCTVERLDDLLGRDIDYEQVEAILNIHRRKAIHFLQRALGMNTN